MLNGRRRFGCCHRNGWLYPPRYRCPVMTLSARHPAQRAIAAAISSIGTSRLMTDGRFQITPAVDRRFGLTLYGELLSIDTSAVSSAYGRSADHRRAVGAGAERATPRCPQSLQMPTWPQAPQAKRLLRQLAPDCRGGTSPALSLLQRMSLKRPTPQRWPRATRARFHHV